MERRARKELGARGARSGHIAFRGDRERAGQGNGQHQPGLRRRHHIPPASAGGIERHGSGDQGHRTGNGGTGHHGVGKIVLGTVLGDIHEIGKNVVAALLRGSGYKVIDLGRDVPIEKFIQACKDSDADIFGASALMTTTMVGQKAIVR